MAISVTCNCGAHSTFEDRYANQQAQCRQCGTPFIIPSFQVQQPDEMICNSPQFQTTIQLIKKELLRYWGYAIAQHCEMESLQQIPGLEIHLSKWKSLIQKLEKLKSQSQVKKLIRQIYNLIYKIGTLCYEQGCHFENMPGIATFEPVIRHIEFMIKVFQCNQSLNNYLHIPQKHRRVFCMLCLLWLCICAGIGNWYFDWQGLYGGVCFGILILLLYWLNKKRQSRLVYWFEKLWWDNLTNYPGEVTAEIAELWIEKIFQHPTLKKYAYKPSLKMSLPEQLPDEFTSAPSLIAGDVSRFDLHAEAELTQWFQRMYRLWSETLRNPDDLQFCFIYQKHIHRVTAWFQQLQIFLQDINNIQGADPFNIARPGIIPGGSLAGITSGLQLVFNKNDYANDVAWSATTELFYTFQLAHYTFNKKNHMSSSAVYHFPIPEFFQALHLCIVELARHKPLLIFLERLELNDQMTLDFLCQAYHQKWPYVCWLFSYDHQRVLQNRSLQDVISQLQADHSWKTPEMHQEILTPPDTLLQKKATWEALEYAVTQCITAHNIQIVGIEGPSGIGKSFLSRRFIDQVGKNQFWTTMYHYQPSHINCPQILGVLKNLLASILQQKNQLKPEETRKVENLLASLSPQYKQTEDNHIVGKMVSNWEVILEILQCLSQYKPIMLLLDNVSWAEQATFDFLECLARNNFLAMMILLTWDNHNTHSAFSACIQTLHNQRCYTEFHLSVPDNHEIANYIEQSFKPHLLAESNINTFIQNIAKATQKSPLLFIEFLKWLIHSKTLVFVGGFWITTREINFNLANLETLLAQFTTILSKEDQELLPTILEVAAVYEYPFELNLLWQEPLLAKMQIQVELLIKFLSQRRLFIQASGESQTCWEFIHEKILQHIQSNINPQRRTQLHQMITKYLEHSNNLSQRLYHAHHAEQWQSVFEFSYTLGKHAQRWNDNITSAKLFDLGIYMALLTHNLTRLAECYLGKASCNYSPENIPELSQKIQWNIIEDSTRFHQIVQAINEHRLSTWSELWNSSRQILQIPLRIMSQRALAVGYFEQDASRAWQLLITLSQGLCKIASHNIRIQTIHAFLSGKYDRLEQASLDELVIHGNTQDQQKIYTFILQALQATPSLPEKFPCLHCFIQQVARVYTPEIFQPMLSAIQQEFQKTKNTFEQALGLLHLATSFSEHNIYTAYESLQNGIQLLAIEKLQEEHYPALAQTLISTISFLPKIPVAVAEITQKQILSFADKLSPATADKVWLEAAIHLSNEPQKIMQLANKISSLEIRRQFLQRIQVLHPQNGLDLLENWISTYSLESYGVIFVRELAEKNLGRARHFLRKLPNNLETQISTARFCGIPGHRIQQLLQLTQGLLEHDEGMNQICCAIIELLESQELDTEGNREILEIWPDESPYKLKILISMVSNLHTIAPQDSSMWLERTIELAIKIIYQGHWNKFVSSWPVLSEQLKCLQAHFVMTYWERWWPLLDMIPDRAVCVAWIYSISYLMRQQMPQNFVDILQLLSIELRSKIEEMSPNILAVSDTAYRIDTSLLESLVALHSIRYKMPEMGQKIFQQVSNSILKIQNPRHKMQAYLAILQANGGLDSTFSQWILNKICELRYPILGEGLPLYYELLCCMQYLPTHLQSELIAKIIDYITGSSDKNFALLNIYRSQYDRQNACLLLQSLTCFDGSCINHFVQRLLAVVPQNVRLNDYIYANQDFIHLIQDLAEDKIATWIQQIIKSWEAWPEMSLIPELQYDFAFIQARGILNLCYFLQDSWILLQTMRQAFDKISYIESRPDLQSEMIWQLTELLDNLWPSLGDVPELNNRTKMLRLQIAYSELVELSDIDNSKSHANLRKKWAYEMLELVSSHIYHTKYNTYDTLPILPIAEPEPLEIQFQQELNRLFQKILLLKSESELQTFFFSIGKILCLLQKETLNNINIPWLHRMIWIASQISAKKIVTAGTDLLQCDEWQQLKRITCRATMINSRMALLFIGKIFTMTRLDEIPSLQEDDELTPKLLSACLPPVSDPELLENRDHLLSSLVLELLEYQWQDAVLLTSIIYNEEHRGKTLVQLLKKAQNVYTVELPEIIQSTYKILKQISSNHSEVWKQFATVIAESHPEFALQILQQSLEPQLQESSGMPENAKLPQQADVLAYGALELADNITNSAPTIKAIHTSLHPELQPVLSKIFGNMEFATAEGLISGISSHTLQCESWQFLCTRLSDMSEIRRQQLKQIWKDCQPIPQVAVPVSTTLLRCGIREQECIECPKHIEELMLAIWQICHHTHLKQAEIILTASFPWLLKIAQDSISQEFFEILSSKFFYKDTHTFKKY